MAHVHVIPGCIPALNRVQEINDSSRSICFIYAIYTYRRHNIVIYPYYRVYLNNAHTCLNRLKPILKHHGVYLHTERRVRIRCLNGTYNKTLLS